MYEDIRGVVNASGGRTVKVQYSLSKEIYRQIHCIVLIYMFIYICIYIYIDYLWRDLCLYIRYLSFFLYLNRTRLKISICYQQVIFETCLLTKEQIIDAAILSMVAGARFVKTSTGKYCFPLPIQLHSFIPTLCSIYIIRCCCWWWYQVSQPAEPKLRMSFSWRKVIITTEYLISLEKLLLCFFI